MESNTLQSFIMLLMLCIHQCDGNPSIEEEINMRTCDVIQAYGYPCETHHVTTKDHYILELQRIPHGIASNITASRNVTFLQHGLLDSSYTWVMNTPDKSLPYILADKGYDVWIGNSRGNTYSNTHEYLKNSDEKYWEFSFSEMAAYDLPACIDYVLQQTGKQQVDYIGHSQGTMIGFAGFGINPSLGRKIKLFIALAPVVTASHVKGMFDFLSHGTTIAKGILKLLGVKNFMPPSWVTKLMARTICRTQALRGLCSSLIFLVAGFDTSNLINERIPIMVAHTPAGTSMKDVLHFIQNHDTSKFRMYDYGWNGNMHKYMQPFPPAYDTSKMNVPVVLFSGGNDWLATPADIAINLRRAGRLQNLVYDESIDAWNHMDFVWGRDANTVIYEKIAQLLQGIIPQQS